MRITLPLQPAGEDEQSKLPFKCFGRWVSILPARSKVRAKQRASGLKRGAPSWKFAEQALGEGPPEMFLAEPPADGVGQ